MSASLLFNLIENEGACDLEYERGGLPFVKASLRLIQPLTLVNAVPSGGTSLIAAAVWPSVDSATPCGAAAKAVDRPRLFLQDAGVRGEHGSLRTCPGATGLDGNMRAADNGTRGLGEALAAACNMAGESASGALGSCQLTAGGDKAAAAAAGAAEFAGRHMAAAHPPVTVCPCWVVAAFVSVLLGLGLTTLVVYGLEWRSRRRFLVGARWGMGAGLGRLLLGEVEVDRILPGKGRRW